MIYELNRSAIRLLPKEDFLNWINYVQTEILKDEDYILTLEEVQASPNVYLIPVIEDNLEEAISFLDSVYQEVFEAELAGWITNEKLWPEDMSLETFYRMFDVDVIEIIYDLVDDDVNYYGEEEDDEDEDSYDEDFDEEEDYDDEEGDDEDGKKKRK